MTKSFISILLFFTTIYSYSQTLRNIEDIETSYQNCLDKGQNMLGCSIRYFQLSDSLLNITYKKLKQKLNADQKIKLKSEQINWLKKRDEYFKKEYLKLKRGSDFNEGSRDFEMIFNDKKGTFVMERVEELIKRI